MQCVLHRWKPTAKQSDYMLLNLPWASGDVCILIDRVLANYTMYLYFILYYKVFIKFYYNAKGFIIYNYILLSYVIFIYF